MRMALLAVGLLFALPAQAWAQATGAQGTPAGTLSDEATPADREAVLAAVETFFRTMTARDPAGARAVLEPEGRFFSIRPGPNGEKVIRSFTNQSYLDGLVGEGPGQVERIWSPRVLVHGDLANVWAPYDFHIDGAFSHCGVDSFDLIRSPNGWKITGGAYTVEREGCAPSPLGPPGV